MSSNASPGNKLTQVQKLPRKLAPLECLPVELMAEILDRAMDVEPSTIVAIKDLCRLWHAFVLASWKHCLRAIYCLPESGSIYFFLSHTKDIEQAVRIDKIMRNRGMSRRERKRIVCAIMRYTPRLSRATTIRGPRSDPWIDWSQFLRHIRSFDNLTFLEICIVPDKQGLPEFSAPRLTYLSLCAPELLRVWAPEMRTFLSRYPTLKTLDFTRFGVHVPITAIEPLHLPHLERLKLHALCPRDFQALREILTINEESLRLRLRLVRTYTIELAELWSLIPIKKASQLRLILRPSKLGIQLILEDAEKDALDLSCVASCSIGLGQQYFVKEYGQGPTEEMIYPELLNDASLYADRVQSVVIAELELGQSVATDKHWAFRPQHMARLLKLFRPEYFQIESGRPLWPMMTRVTDFLCHWSTLHTLIITCVPQDMKSAIHEQVVINEVAAWLSGPRVHTINVMLVGYVYRQKNAEGGEEGFSLNLEVLRSRCRELADEREL